MTAWNPLLRDQFEWHWEHQLRSRLAGLSDEEYFWEPVEGGWSVRPRGTATTPMVAGAGDFTNRLGVSRADYDAVDREMIHRLAEVSLLRDLYTHTERMH
jgi:hypothetical protein